MNKKTTARRIGSIVAAAALLGLSAGPAFAATVSQASGNAITGTLLGTSLIDTGTETATNDGSAALVTEKGDSPLHLLEGQKTTGVGVVSTMALADKDGNSAACSGVVGDGGSITVGDTGDCTINGGGSEVAINLGSPDPLLGLNLLPISLTADAIYSSCTAGPNGYTAVPHFANAALHIGAFDLPINADGTIVGLTGMLKPLAALIEIDVNQKSVTATESSATALHVSLLKALGTPLTEITIGEVHCGPNAAAPDVPVIPAAGIPAALAVFALGGLAVFVVYRRKAATAPVSK